MYLVGWNSQNRNFQLTLIRAIDDQSLFDYLMDTKTAKQVLGPHYTKKTRTPAPKCSHSLKNANS